MKKNILSLASLQVANYLVPLLTVPWLTRVLGIEGYGRLGFAAAVIANFIIFTEWGFSLGATREIAISKLDKYKRSEIFWNVIAGKVFFAVLGLVVLSLMILLVPKLYNNATLLYITWCSVIATILSPMFYFQGVERLSHFAVVTLLARILSVPMIFIFVQHEDDVCLAALVQSSFLVVAATINLTYLLRSSELYWQSPSIKSVAKYINTTTPFFISSVSISLYTNSSTIVLGFLASEEAVGAFVGAYTLIRAALSLMSPVSQALFPKVSHMLTHDRGGAEKVLRKALIFQTAFGLAISLLVLIAAGNLVHLLFGDSFNLSRPILYIFSILPFLIAISNVFGVQILAGLGYSKIFSRSVIGAGVLCMILVVPLSIYLGAEGAAISMVLAEAVVTVAMVWLVRVNEPKIWTSLLGR